MYCERRIKGNARERERKRELERERKKYLHHVLQYLNIATLYAERERVKYREQNL